MAKQRSTFGKLQRAAEKREKAQAKVERRAARAAESDEAEPAPEQPQIDEAIVLEALAELQASYAEGRIGTEEFETRREQLAGQLQLN